MSHAVITANRLRDGIAVWRGPDGEWMERLALARAFPADEAEVALATAKQDIARRLVVGVYPIQVTLRDGVIAPDSTREAIRAAGPSVRLDLGIQAGAVG